MSPKFIDAHTHVQFAAYQDDVDAVVKRSLDAGIWMVNVGTQLDTSKKAIDLTEKYPQGVYATVGLHPIHTDKSFHDKEELGEGGEEFTSRGEVFDYDGYKKLALHPKVVAIGECGLDYYRSHNGSKEKQEAAFIQQIELAHDVKKPLMLHCRAAFPDLIRILTTNYKLLTTPFPGIIHFFSGTEPQASDLLNIGLFFTFGGVITFARDYDEIIKSVPVSRMMLETDAPYVTPAPHRGRRNEPSYVAEIARKLAEIKGVSWEEIQHHTTENARAIFGI